LDSFGLLDKVIAYVKDKGSNINTFAFALNFVVSCFSLQLPCPFVGSYFSHAMPKITQNAIDNMKNCVRFLKVSLKEVQSSLQYIITWIKNFRMGRLELKESCTIVWLFAKMLRTLVVATLTFGSRLSVKSKAHEVKSVFKCETHSHKWGRV
jgi:phage-related protein